MQRDDSQGPAEYTRQRALELRHDWQLSRLFLPPDNRDAFNALLALRVELAQQLADVSEAAIGVVKLEWWRNEIMRGFTSAAQHPLAIQLGEALGARNIAVEYVIEQVDAIEMAFISGSVESYADEKLFRYRRDGVLAEIAAQLSDSEYLQDERSLMHAARTIGELRAHVDAITSIPAQLRSGHAVFSQQRFATHGVTIGAPLAPHAMDTLLESVWQTWNELRIAARTAMEDVVLPPALLVQWRLLESDYRTLAKQRDTLKTESPALAGPLRRLFIAWRAARSAIKTLQSKAKG